MYRAECAAFVIDAPMLNALNYTMGNLTGGLTGFIVALLLTACGGNRHFHATDPAATTSTPPYLELRSQPSVATLHFPPGVYVLDAVDDNGYYYRAPRKIFQHSFSGGQQYRGGIFVAKRDSGKLRGYVIMPGGLTHVGNFAHADYEFRQGDDNTAPYPPVAGDDTDPNFAPRKKINP